MRSYSRILQFVEFFVNIFKTSLFFTHSSVYNLPRSTKRLANSHTLPHSTTEKRRREAFNGDFLGKNPCQLRNSNPRPSNSALWLSGFRPPASRHPLMVPKLVATPRRTLAVVGIQMSSFPKIGWITSGQQGCPVANRWILLFVNFLQWPCAF